VSHITARQLNQPYIRFYRFNTQPVPGAVIDQNRATCVMPPIYATGYIDLFVEVDGSNDLLWKGKFLVETPFTAPELVSFPENDPYEKYPQKISIRWDYKNLTLDMNTPVSITLFGYRENTIKPELIYIDTLAVRPFIISVLKFLNLKATIS
jgi:hypothetical protein